MLFNRSTLSVVLSLLVWAKNTDAFGVRPLSSVFTSRSSVSRLAYSDQRGSEEFFSQWGDRLSAEELFSKSPGLTGYSKETGNLLLTSRRLKTREREIKLLKSLYHSDAAVGELINMWTTEHGDSHAETLWSVQEQTAARRAQEKTHTSTLARLTRVHDEEPNVEEIFVEEEARLSTMIKESPGWAEPFAQLAAIYYCKGKLNEAKRMARQAMELKPWHIEAPYILAHISKKANDQRQASYWSKMAMPPLTGCKEKRRQWVEYAVTEAQKKLAESRKVTLEWLSNGEGAAFE